MTDEVAAVIGAYAHYEKGFLPEPGGWLDQAWTYCESMKFLSQRINHHQEKAAHHG